MFKMKSMMSFSCCVNPTLNGTVGIHTCPYLGKDAVVRAEEWQSPHTRKREGKKNPSVAAIVIVVSDTSIQHQ